MTKYNIRSVRIRSEDGITLTERHMILEVDRSVKSKNCSSTPKENCLISKNWRKLIQNAFKKVKKDKAVCPDEFSTETFEAMEDEI